MQWSDEGMNSSYKFIQKLWNLNQKIIEKINLDHEENSDNSIERICNHFVKSVTNNIENFAYNKIIANFHETYSALNNIISNKIGKDQLVNNYKKILITMNPIIPHFSNECLEMIGVNDKILWPKIDEQALLELEKNFIIQINGKTREIIVAEKDISQEDLLVKVYQNSKLKNYIEGKIIKRKIFVPGKLLNIIIT